MALVSACVWRERGEQRPRVREDMQGPYRSLLEAARRIGKVGAVVHAHAAWSALVADMTATSASSQLQSTTFASQGTCSSMLEGSSPYTWPP